MSTFDSREKGFERKFAHDEELAFKIVVRRNKLLGLWAAAKLGKSAADAEQYAKDVVAADFESAGNNDVIEKILKDFVAGGVSATARDIDAEMEKLLPVAREQIKAGSK
jgi:hypothetical protein